MDHLTRYLPYDLTTPDGVITSLKTLSDKSREAEILIKDIHAHFVGFEIEKEHLLFNIKSTLAQLGVDAECLEIELNPAKQEARCRVRFFPYGAIAETMVSLLKEGLIVGKIFAKDPRRRVRDPDYLSRMFSRSDRWGRPLLSLGGMRGSQDLVVDKIDGRCVAYLTLLPGTVNYDFSIFSFLPTLIKGLNSNVPMRSLLKLQQNIDKNALKIVEPNEILLVKTQPLHIRTVFAHIVDDLLPKGYRHTSASILQPDTYASGDIYELFGESKREITDIPLEFYTLEPYREYIFFSDRDHLKKRLEDRHALEQAFETAPSSPDLKSAVFVVKGSQMENLKESDWISHPAVFHDFPGSAHPERQALTIEHFLEKQPDYPFLKLIQDEVITSQGVLLTRYFPSPLMKKMYFNDQVLKNLKGIYFLHASHSHPEFFSQEDHAFLHDLDTFGIPLFWMDPVTKQILQYVQKKSHDSGMFVPTAMVDMFRKITLFGVYGSNLFSDDFGDVLKEILEGIKDLKNHVHHDLLNPDTPLGFVTGGGPGAMELGNKIAQETGFLSCANIVDFGAKPGMVVNEQKQNPYIDGKMTYRLDKLIERQAEFNLDFPLFLTGGVGTDFEFYLEQVRRKTGSVRLTPVILLGELSYWEKKITAGFTCNVESGTIKGSEWISNSFYQCKNAEEALFVYRKFFEKTLPIGKESPVYPRGFVAVSEEMAKEELPC